MSNNNRPSIGGQAVIEGVMMRGTECLATAVRKPSGEIVYKKTKINGFILGLTYFFVCNCFLRLPNSTNTHK